MIPPWTPEAIRQRRYALQEAVWQHMQRRAHPVPAWHPWRALLVMAGHALWGGFQVAGVLWWLFRLCGMW